MDADHSKAIYTAAEGSSQTISKYLDNPSGRSAKMEALCDAKKLVRELEDGDDSFRARVEHCAAAYALRFIIAIGALEKIPGTGSIKAEQLAADILRVRMMRMIVAGGDIEEVAQDEYAMSVFITIPFWGVEIAKPGSSTATLTAKPLQHTRRSINLPDPAYRNFFEIMMDDFCFTWAKLPEYYKLNNREPPRSPSHNPYSWFFDMEGQHWVNVIGRTPERLEKFVHSINGKLITGPATRIYPFDTELAPLSAAVVEDKRTLIVDVGGSRGGTMKQVREAYPAFKGRIIVQDIPQVIAAIPKGFLPSELDIHPQVHDFWGAQHVRSAAVYYLRRVLHDWPDDSCQVILRNIAAAMGPDSKLLVAETCVPERVQKEDPFCYWMDLTMLTFAGEERNEVEWLELFASVGFDLVRVWKAATGTQAVMEGRLKKS